MTIKRKLAPFFAVGALVSSVAANAQTATNPDTGSSATGQAPAAQPGMQAGDSTGTAGDTPTAPGVSSPDQSSGEPAKAPGTSGDGTTMAPQTNGPSNTDSSNTSKLPADSSKM